VGAFIIIINFFCWYIFGKGCPPSFPLSSTIIVHSTSSNKVYINIGLWAYNLPNGSGLVACGSDGGGPNLKVFSPSLMLVYTLANSFAREVAILPSNFGTLPMEAW